MKQFALVTPLVLGVMLSGSAFGQNSAFGLHSTPLTKDFEPTTATAPEVIADFAIVDSGLPDTPCLNCVNGTTLGTLGLTAPTGYIPSTETEFQLVLYFTDISYTGTCHFSFAVKQGTTAILSLSGNFKAHPAEWVIDTTQSRPSASGAAILVGTVKCGTNPATSVRAPLYFQ